MLSFLQTALHPVTHITVVCCLFQMMLIRIILTSLMAIFFFLSATVDTQPVILWHGILACDDDKDISRNEDPSSTNNNIGGKTTLISIKKLNGNKVNHFAGFL